MSNINKQALNQEKIEWLNKLADMEYCKRNPGHWLMSLKDINMLARLALSSVALLDELEAKDKQIAELEAREVKFTLPSELTAEDCDILTRSIDYGTGWNLALSSCEQEFIRALTDAGIRINGED